MCFYYEDAYYYCDIDADKILLHKKCNNEYFITYKHSNKMDIVPLQLKIKKIFYKVCDYNNSDDIIYIENSDKEFFEKISEIWNKIIELTNINNAPNFVQTTLDDGSEFIEADVLENTRFVESNYDKDEIIIVLHSVVNNNLKASLLQVTKYEY